MSRLYNRRRRGQTSFGAGAGRRLARPAAARADPRDDAELSDPVHQQKQPIILALDTSASCTSIAVAHGDRIIGRLVASGDERRSERLWLDIGELLQGAGLALEAVDVLSVCVGPGGFTGLRVGLAAAKGLAAAAGLPVIGVTSLEALAIAATGAAVACAMTGAYKGEVYWQLFACGDRGLPVARSEPHVSTSREALAQVADLPDVVFVGDAVSASVEVIREMAGSRFIAGDGAISGGWRIQPTAPGLAEAVAHVAYLKWQQGAVDSAEGLRALYLRPAEAEVKRSLGLLGSKIARSRKAD